MSKPEQAPNRYRFTVEQIAELKEAFSLFDQDGSGSIEKEELGAVMRSLGQNPTEAELDDMMNEVDTDGSGEMDFKEFLQLMGGRMQSSYSADEITEAFRVFDRTDCGSIPVDDLRYIIEARGDYLGEEVREELIRECHPTRNGLIIYSELIQRMLAMSGD